jgi:chitin disaccharide deacetylase
VLTLYPRADDAGSSRAANLAIADCVKAGIIKNVSVMAAPAASVHAAEVLKDLDKDFDICFGLHVTLTSEWDGIKWGPVSRVDEVASLLEPTGYFPAESEKHIGRLNIAEALKECKAQLEKLRELGFQISYLDEHMGVAYYHMPELHQALIDFAKAEGLYHVDVIRPMKEIDLSHNALAHLEQLVSDYPNGEYIYFSHPALDDTEMDVCYNAAIPRGKIRKERSNEHQLLYDPQTKKMFDDKKVKLESFKTLLPKNLS